MIKFIILGKPFCQVNTVRVGLEEIMGRVLLRGTGKIWNSEVRKERMDFRQVKKGETLGSGC